MSDEPCLSKIHEEVCFGLFYDILIYSKSLQEYLTHLQIVFDIMVQQHLLAKQSKYVFGISKVEYLGHFISCDGVSTDPWKIQVVQHWPTPGNLKQLRGFLGLAVYYRKFIKGYGVLSSSLTKLLKKDNLIWSDNATQAFNNLKVALTSALVPTIPDYSIPFVIEIDVNGFGIGVVLMQNDHPIAFISHGLSSCHVALFVYEKELLALVFVVTKWSHYFLGQHFIVQTYQKALSI